MRPEVCAGMVLGLIIMFIFGLMWGNSKGEERIKKEAIIHNAAFYTTDQFGNPIFAWNDQ